MTPSLKTIDVPHLGGSTVGYRMAKPYVATRPTLVLVNSFSTSSLLYRPQFEDGALSAAANLIALEPYGHGATRSSFEQFTYWDSAIANLLALDALGIRDKVAVLGTSQGGWIATRMAILDPERIQGLVVLGTSMDCESEDSRSRGCWNGPAFNTPLIDSLAAPVDADWHPDDDYCNGLIDVGFGSNLPQSERHFWQSSIKENYRGDDGRRRLRVAAINLRDRDPLHARLDSITCPVLWLQGSGDPVYSVRNAEDGIARFVCSSHAELKTVEGGQHYLSASHPARVNSETLDFLRRFKSR